MRRVLIITYYWPPSGGGGVQRWLKFARHLQGAGWEPVVIAPADAAYPVFDPSLEADVPEGLEVHRVPIWEPFELAGRLLGQQATEVERLGASSGDAEKSSSGSGRLAKWVRGNLFIPDARVGWVGPVVRTAKRILTTGSVDAMITTGPPHSVHLAGLKIQAATGVPWVADFRDPWSDIDYLDDFHLTAWARRRHRTLEQRVVAACDRVLVTAWGAAEGLLGGEVRENERVWWIPNGWDAEDFEGSAEVPAADGPMDLVHFGSLYATRNFPAVWEAVKAWNASGRGREVRLVFYGNTAPEVIASLQEHLEPEREFVVRGNLPHKDAVAAMRASHALLILHNNTESGRRCIPGKVFEYLAAQRPVLGIGPAGGDMEWIIESDIRAAGAPWHFHAPDDSKGIEASLASIAEASSDCTERFDAERFERSQLAAELGRRLDELVAAKENPDRPTSVNAD